MQRPHLTRERHHDDAEDDEENPLRDEGSRPPPAHRIVQVGCFRSSMNWINGLPSSARPTSARSSPSASSSRRIGNPSAARPSRIRTRPAPVVQPQRRRSLVRQRVPVGHLVALHVGPEGGRGVRGQAELGADLPVAVSEREAGRPVGGKTERGPDLAVVVADREPGRPVRGEPEASANLALGVEHREERGVVVRQTDPQSNPARRIQDLELLGSDDPFLHRWLRRRGTVGVCLSSPAGRPTQARQRQCALERHGRRFDAAGGGRDGPESEKPPEPEGSSGLSTAEHTGRPVPSVKGARRFCHSFPTGARTSRRVTHAWSRSGSGVTPIPGSAGTRHRAVGRELERRRVRSSWK